MIAGAIVVSAAVLMQASHDLGVSRTTTVARSPTYLYTVTFKEADLCVPPRAPTYHQSWFVTMGNVTIVQPSNVTLPQLENQTSDISRPSYETISTIMFVVPDGSYLYYTSFGGNHGSGTAGTVNVNGTDQVVPVQSSTFCP